MIYAYRTPAEYHPYKDGYKVTPGLRPLSHDFGNGDVDQKFFQIDENYYDYIAEKRKRLKGYACIASNTRQDSNAWSWQTRDHIHNWMATKLKEEHPDFEPQETLDGLVLQIQEDIAIHCVDGDVDWLAYAHICMPSGWNPVEKVGKSFRGVHKPIPGMLLDRSEVFAGAMAAKGPFVRFVWGLTFEDRLSMHPDLPRKRFDPKNPEIYVRVERQVTQPFPEQKAFLFLIRLYLIPFEKIVIPLLISALETMTKEQLEYKGFAKDYRQLMKFLKKNVPK